MDKKVSRKQQRKYEENISALEIERQKLQEELRSIKRYQNLLKRHPERLSSINEALAEKLKAAKYCKLLFAHRLTGVTVLRKNDNEVVLRLETFYDGIYCDNYIIHFAKSQENPQDDRYAVKAHTFPQYFRMELLLPEQKYEGLALPLERIRQHIFAHAIRKVQVIKVKEAYTADEVMIEPLESHMYIGVRIWIGSPLLRKLVLHLKYRSLDPLPVRVDFDDSEGTQLPTSNQSEIRTIVREFQVNEILDAIKNVLQ